MGRRIRVVAFGVDEIGGTRHEHFYQPDKGGEYGDDDENPKDIEGTVGHGGSPGRHGAADGGELGGDRGADVLTHDQSDSGVNGDRPCGSQGDGNAQHGGAALHDHGHDAADGDATQQAQQRLRIQQQHEVHEALMGSQGFEGVAHDLQAEKDKTQSDKNLGYGGDPLVLGKKHRKDAESDQQQAIFTHLDCEDPAGDGGADIGAEDNPYGLAQLHEPGIGQADDHDGGDGGRLYKGRDGQADDHRQDAVGSQGGDRFADEAAGEHLQAVGEIFHPEDENSEAAQDRVGHLERFEHRVGLSIVLAVGVLGYAMPFNRKSQPCQGRCRVLLLRFEA